MKKQAYIIIAAIMLVTVAGLSTAQAQTSGNTNMDANIPFDFSVGDKVMPAGEYTVTCVNPASSVKVLQIRSKAGTASAMVRTNSINGTSRDDARLVFHRYGNEYFFSQAWLPAESIGMKAPKSRGAKTHELAGAAQTTETVLARVRR